MRAEDEAKGLVLVQVARELTKLSGIGMKGIEALGFSSSRAFVKHLEREGI